VDNDSAEVTSSGRSFHVREPTTLKARMVGDGCSLTKKYVRDFFTGKDAFYVFLT